ncbi:MAG: RnfABCDGE type electron transport complex subunit D [Treponemataceae bacterium]|nr:RnfABCDGE type electron transport complex subunit D [Treponemataceae bacterium]
MNVSHIHVARKPLIHITLPTYTRMWIVSIAALGGIIQSALTDRGYSLLLALVAVVTALVVELLVGTVHAKYNTMGDGSSITTALILTLMMPHTIHPAVLVLGVLFALLVVKHSFGGLGANWFNPALGGWLFAYLSWPHLFRDALMQSYLVKIQEGIGKGIMDPGGSPLAVLKYVGFTTSSLDESLVSFFNRTLFSHFDAELPRGYFDLLFYTGPGIIADRGSLGLLLGTMLLLAFSVVRFLVPLLYLFVYLVLVRLYGAVPFGGSFGGGDMLFALLSGGTVLTAFIILCEPVTGTKSLAGALFMACMVGVLSFLFVYQGGILFGSLYAMAVGVVFIPWIREMETVLFYKKARRIP